MSTALLVAGGRLVGRPADWPPVMTAVGGAAADVVGRLGELVGVMRGVVLLDVGVCVFCCVGLLVGDPGRSWATETVAKRERAAKVEKRRERLSDDGREDTILCVGLRVPFE